MLAGLALVGCGPSSVELVALRGCGLDQAFSGLRVRVLGDLGVGAGTELVLGPGELGELESLPEGATGLAAEGLFGTTVTAIGRSWGIDGDRFRARLGRSGQALPVWFAAPDGLCPIPIESAIEAREALGVGVGREADLLLAGGLDGGGELVGALVHIDLLTGSATTLGPGLATPVRDPIVVPGPERSFVILGGIGSMGPSDAWTRITLGAEVEVEAGSSSLEGEPWAVADPAVARGGEGGDALLLAGGCTLVDGEGGCVSGSSSAQAGRLAWASSTIEPLPPLEVARHGASAVWSRDGVAWVAGGWDSAGLGLGSLERLRPGGAWDLVHELDDRTILGLAVLDEGIALLTDETGAVHWWSDAGSGTLDPTSRAPPLDPTTERRPMLALAGERVLVEGWLFSPGSAASDPALERVMLSQGAQTNAVLTPLLDGTVVLGGWTDAGVRLERLRPRLDGPDEWIPDLTGPQTDAFVATIPGAALVGVGGLRITGSGTGQEGIAASRAHVRGFRSASARVELEAESDPGTVAQLILGQGSATVVAVDLNGDQAGTVRARGPSGSVETLGCELGPGQLSGPVVVEITEGGERLRVSADDGQALACALAWPVPDPLLIGFGSLGTGAARFFGLRLARI